MSFETRIEPLDGRLPKVSYRWDPETDILSVACKGVAKASGLNGTVDLEGDDGSFVLLDVAGGGLRGGGGGSRPGGRRTPPTLGGAGAPQASRGALPRPHTPPNPGARGGGTG